MYLHITPSFNIDRLCKTASVLLFLVQIFNRTETIRLYTPQWFLSMWKIPCFPRRTTCRGKRRSWYLLYTLQNQKHWHLNTHFKIHLRLDKIVIIKILKIIVPTALHCEVSIWCTTPKTDHSQYLHLDIWSYFVKHSLSPLTLKYLTNTTSNFTNSNPVMITRWREETFNSFLSL